MEEKKNNKGLIIGLIIFLIICLIIVFYLMFKIIYKESSGNTNLNESINNSASNIEQDNSVLFSKLTKYELKEGEEKEVTVDGKKVTLKFNNGEYYLNDKNIGVYSYYHVTDKFIIFYKMTEGNIASNAVVYNKEAEEIELDKTGLIYDYEHIILENDKLLITGYVSGMIAPTWSYEIDNLIIEDCNMLNNNHKSKTISEYMDIVNKHLDDILEGIYEIKYEDNKIKFELYEAKQTIKQYLENADLNNICAVEKSN
jgi:hypothetical protein